MLKKYFLGFMVLLSFSHANEEKWFVDLGWQISAPTTSGSYDLFDTSGSAVMHFDWDGTYDMLYADAGRMFTLQESEALISVSIGTTFTVLDNSDHLNILFGKASLLYPATLFGTNVKIGPKVKVLFPYNSYYYDEEFGADARKVEYSTNSAFALGAESIWGEGDWKVVTGIEYLTSAKYKGTYRDDNGYANSEIDLNGLYFNIGLRYSF